MSDATIEGRWQIVRAELSGAAMPEFAARQTELELAQGRYTVRFGGETRDEGTYSLGDSAGAQEMSFAGVAGPNAGRTIPAMYQLMGDRLRICYGLAGERPTEFATTADSKRYLVTYRRLEQQSPSVST